MNQNRAHPTIVAVICSLLANPCMAGTITAGDNECFITETRTTLHDDDESSLTCNCRYGEPLAGCPADMISGVSFVWYRQAVANEAGSRVLTTGQGRIGTRYLCSMSWNYYRAAGCAAVLAGCTSICVGTLGLGCVACIAALAISGCGPCDLIVCSQDPDGYDYLGEVVTEVNESCYGGADS